MGKKGIVFIFLFSLAALVVIGQEPYQALSADSGASPERGKYIVERVAMCVECHTPRDDNGRIIRTKYLLGAPVPVKAPPFPNMKWAIKAPAIAGLPGYTREEGIRLLTRGITASGRVPDPPMPAFRLNSTDAAAVVAYLKSLQ
ncbi:MAG: c-type cytochrome [Deltaproteobacteria bacterium]|nr:c-type cytochrome [Deltaproteobacteria bacterium]